MAVSVVTNIENTLMNLTDMRKRAWSCLPYTWSVIKLLQIWTWTYIWQLGICHWQQLTLIFTIYSDTEIEFPSHWGRDKMAAISQLAPTHICVTRPQWVEQNQMNFSVSPAWFWFSLIFLICVDHITKKFFFRPLLIAFKWYTLIWFIYLIVS